MPETSSNGSEKAPHVESRYEEVSARLTLFGGKRHADRRPSVRSPWREKASRQRTLFCRSISMSRFRAVFFFFLRLIVLVRHFASLMTVVSSDRPRSLRPSKIYNRPTDLAMSRVLKLASKLINPLSEEPTSTEHEPHASPFHLRCNAAKAKGTSDYMGSGYRTRYLSLTDVT